MNSLRVLQLSLLYCALLLSTAAVTQAAESSYKRLAVDDFRVDEKLERPSVMKVAGFCTLRFGVGISEQNGRATARIVSWRVSSGFSREESVRIHPRKWKATAEELARTVAHEQGHLDINETHANLLRAKKKNLPKGHGKTPAAAGADLKAKIESLLAESARRCEEVQDRYDRETNHGIRQREQRIWEAQIAADLNRSMPPRHSTSRGKAAGGSR